MSTSANCPLSLHPKNATASRAINVHNAVGPSSPIAHLDRIHLSLTWTGSSSGTQLTTTESQSSQSTESGYYAADEFIPSDNEEAQPLDTSKTTGPASFILCSKNVDDLGMGPLPVWAIDQIRTAVIKLFRAELIK